MRRTASALLLAWVLAPAWARGEEAPKESKPAAASDRSADTAVLSEDGSAVGPLDKHRVKGKYTVFDVYAEWCNPCRLVDRHLKTILTQRQDVAVRKLNVVDFDSPLARELGPDFDSLPYVIVYSPQGKRVEIFGADLDRLDAALRPR
jgi:thiol:disulfide interchange protein